MRRLRQLGDRDPSHCRRLKYLNVTSLIDHGNTISIGSGRHGKQAIVPQDFSLGPGFKIELQQPVISRVAVNNEQDTRGTREREMGRAPVLPAMRVTAAPQDCGAAAQAPKDEFTTKTSAVRQFLKCRGEKLRISLEEIQSSHFEGMSLKLGPQLTGPPVAKDSKWPKLAMTCKLPGWDANLQQTG